MYHSYTRHGMRTFFSKLKNRPFLPTRPGWLSTFKQGSFLLAGHLLVFYILINEMLFSPIYPESRVQSARAEAAALAHADQLDEAEQRLKAILNLVPDNQSIWVDYLVVLSWNQKHAQALDALKHIDLTQAPEYFFSPLIGSAIRTDQPQLAFTLYQQHPNPTFEEGITVLKSLATHQWDSYAQMLTQALEQKFPEQQQDLQDIQTFLAGIEPVSSSIDSSSPGSESIVSKSNVSTPYEDQPPSSQEITALQPSPKNDTPQWIIGSDSENLTHQSAAPVVQISLEQQAKHKREAGALEAAQQLYQQGLQQAPEHKQLTIGLALVLAEQGRFDRAYPLLSKAIDQNPRDTQVLNALIYYHQLKGDKEAELNTLAQLLVVDPSESTAQYWVENVMALKPQLSLAHISNQVETLHQHIPQSKVLLFNHIALLEQNNQCEKALDYKDTITSTPAVPIYVFETLWRCARTVKAYDQAKSIAFVAQRQHPEHSDFFIYDALIDIDQGQAAKGLNTLATIQPSSKDYYYAKAYGFETLNKPLDAAFTYQSLFNQWPSEQSAFVNMCLQLSNAGGALRALNLAQTQWAAFGTEEQAHLKANLTAFKIRDALNGHPDPQKAQQKNARALQSVQAHLIWLSSRFESGAPHIQQARFDLIIALKQANLMNEVLSAHQAILNDGIQPPPYVLKAVSEAYLYLEQPEKAHDIVRQIEAIHPEDFSTQTPLYYALLEQEQYPQAEQVSNTISRKEPIWRVSHNNKIWRDNPKKLDADRLTSLHQAYDSQLAAAQTEMEQRLKKAPANTTLRNDLATVYRYRGWPQAAAKQINLIEAIEPQYKNVQINKALNTFDLNDFPALEYQLASLSDYYPRDKAVIKLNAQWQAHNAMAFSSKMNLSRGESNTFTSNTMQWHNYLFSPRLNYHTRLFAYDYFQDGKFSDRINRRPGEPIPSITSTLHFFGAGLEYQYQKHLAKITLFNKLSHENETGFHYTQDYQFNDLLSLGLALSHLSEQTPLAADFYGVTMDELNLNARVRYNESRSLSANVQYATFSESQTIVERGLTADPLDENTRLSASLTHKHRLYQNAHHVFSMSETLNMSDYKNTDSRIYFSPDQTFSLGAAFHYDGIIRRHYDNTFKQHLTIALGPHWQKNVDTEEGLSNATDFFAQLYYEQRWDWGHQLSLFYGASLSRAVYDGDAEFIPALRLGIEGRFL